MRARVPAAPRSLLEQALAEPTNCLQGRTASLPLAQRLELALAVLRGTINQAQASRALGVSRAACSATLVSALSQGVRAGLLKVSL